MPVTGTPVALELELVSFLEELKKRLQRHPEISRFNFDIHTEGRVDGDLKVDFRLGINYDPDTKGGNLSAVLDEALRRFDWTLQNDSLCLPNVNPIP